MAVPLLEAILGQPSEVRVWDQRAEEIDGLAWQGTMSRLSSSTPLEVTNAAAWARITGGYDYPYCASPPWDNYWFEFTDPDKRGGWRQGGHHRVFPLPSQGWIVSGEYYARKQKGHIGWAGMDVCHIGPDGKYGSLSTLNGDDEFVMHYVFQKILGESPPRGWDHYELGFPKGHEAHRTAQIVRNNCTLAITAALTFAHAKGTKLRDVHPPESVQKARKRKGKPPKITHKVLVIDGGAARAGSGSSKQANPKGKAFHIARGHFATYTKDAPLFGHYVGTVWKPMHVRGNKKHGTVHKQYEIKP